MKEFLPTDAVAKIRGSLVSLGPEKLADALMELSDHSPDAENMVERLITQPGEIIQRFKTKLTAIKRTRRFLSWREVPGFARDLSGLLDDLEEGVEEGKIGVQLVSRFFECDQAIIESCDDSSGIIGGVFNYEATRLFAHFAMDCADKNWLSKQLLKLYAGNDYGLRDNLLESAGLFLPKENLRDLADQFWNLAEKGEDDFQQRNWFRGVEELAVQLGNPSLFEKARLASWGKPGTAACLDIAEIYLKNGEIQKALSWVENDQDSGSFMKDKRDLLLQAIYSELGDSEKVGDILWSRFRQFYSVSRLDELVAEVGQDKRETIISEAVENILGTKMFRGSDTEFLLQAGCLDNAEKHLLQSAEQFDGNFYSTLLPLAQAMEDGVYRLAASLLYRALLDSILERGYTKAYSHGVGYLKKLDCLAEVIDNWQRFDSHEQYTEGIRLTHGRKRSFWGKYDK